MPDPVKAAILIPVYNHGTTLRHVVLDALRQHPDVIVVDDGCTDDGPESITDLPVHLVRHERNRGKGAAIRSGAATAAALGYTHVITMDADGQHKAEDIPNFLDAIQETPWSIIIGARDFSVPNVPGSSRFGRKFSQFWMFVQTGLSISDMQSGFRAYPTSILEHVPCSDSRYSFEIEIIVRAAWAGFAIREIPVRVFSPPPGRTPLPLQGTGGQSAYHLAQHQAHHQGLHPHPLLQEGPRCRRPPLSTSPRANTPKPS